MSSRSASRKARRAQARAERLEAEAHQREAAERRRRIQRLAIVAGVAVLLVGGAIVISQSGSDADGDGDASAQSNEVAALYDDIRQQGNTLGSPDAPLTMLEFADPQCPFCAEYSANVLPEIIDRYVRPGELRLELNLLTFIGPDSERAARVAESAGLQDGMWEYVDLLYGQQGAENSGYATDEFLRELAAAVPGLDVEQVFAERDSDAVSGRLARAQASATRLGVNSTPTFFVGDARGNLRPLDVASLEPDAFISQLDSLTSGGAGE